MKRYEIKKVEKKNNYYEIWLGNGTINRFTNQKAATKFLSDTNEFLTRQLFDLNNIYSELHQHYRKCWILLEPCEQVKSNKIRSELECIDDILENSYLKSKYEAGNYYAFLDLLKSCRFIINTIEFLRIYDKRRSSTIDVYHLDNLKQRTLNVMQGLNSYSQITCSETFEPPKEGELIRLNPPHLKHKTA